MIYIIYHFINFIREVLQIGKLFWRLGARLAQAGKNHRLQTEATSLHPVSMTTRECGMGKRNLFLWIHCLLRLSPSATAVAAFFQAEKGHPKDEGNYLGNYKHLPPWKGCYRREISD